MNEVTKRLQREAQRIAAKHPAPEFYTRFKAPLALARKLYYGSPMVNLMRAIVEPILQEDLGHGIFHTTHVCLDCATLVWVEAQFNRPRHPEVERLMVLGLLAGLLHDIRRNEKNHAEAGAEAAEEMLTGLALSKREMECICLAIRNHEAFTTPVPSRLPWVQLISDCLYDADKFRWGADTFTHTLWHMANRQGLSLQHLVDRFPWGMSGVTQILDTFRTSTGREFGPEIVQTGLEIGKEIYRYLLQRLREEPHEE